MTFAALWALPWVRKAAAVLAIAAVVGLVAWRLVEHGKDLGQEKQKQESQQELEKMRAADREAVGRVIAEATRRAEDAEARTKASVEREAKAAQLAATLAQQRVQAATSVATIPDAGLHAYVVDKLGKRTAEDRGAACYTTAEERELARCVTEFPYASDQVKAADASIAELRGQVQSIRDELGAVKEREAARAGYTQRLEGYYVTLYNLHAKKRRAKQCLWLWSCKAPHLEVPAPEDLEGGKTK